MKKETMNKLQFDTVRVIEVIETTLTRRGDGKDAPVRVIRQYWSKGGELLAEVDPSPDHLREIAKHQEAGKAALRLLREVNDGRILSDKEVGDCMVALLQAGCQFKEKT